MSEGTHTIGGRRIPRSCDSSASIHPTRPGEYWYLNPNGYWHSLCAYCCAVWRKNAEEDPSLAAVRIVSVMPSPDC